MPDEHASAAPQQGRDSEAGQFKAGDVIAGRYELLVGIDEGAMGSLWSARDRALDQPAVVKLVRSGLAGAERQALAAELINEARACAQLDHPAIVKTLDFGQTTGGEPYIVLEQLEGEDLRCTLQRRRRIPAVKAVRGLLPVIHGLAAAHDARIVHRDIKPENIFMAQCDGVIRPKLIDFGVAATEQISGEALRGSPAYLSPEAAQGALVDHRSDIWSLCVVLYEAVTGQPPFVGATLAKLIRAIIEEPPKPSTEHGAADDELWQIIAQGLAKRPAERWRSMRALGTALAGWLIAQGETADISGASLAEIWQSSASSRRPGAGPEEAPEPTAEGRSQPPPSLSPPAARSRRLTIAIALIAVVGVAAGLVLGRSLVRQRRGERAPQPAGASAGPTRALAGRAGAAAGAPASTGTTTPAATGSAGRTSAAAGTSATTSPPAASPRVSPPPPASSSPAARPPTPPPPPATAVPPPATPSLKPFEL